MGTVRNDDFMTLWLAKEEGLELRGVHHPYLFGIAGRLFSCAEARNWRFGVDVVVEFELCRVLRDKSQKIKCFLLNGDLGTNRNRRHQATFRRLVEEMAHERLIVPFSALRAALIDIDTIEPIEIREDRWTETRHNVAPWNKADVKWSPEPSDNWAARRYGTWQHGVIPGRNDIRFSRRLSWEGVVEAESAVARFRGEPVREDDEGLHWIERRHWLGDSLFKAKVNGRFRTFVSSFDYQERFPLYFLAEVPDRTVKNVDDAILALSPPIVHAAVAQGRDVKRQGDMFAIPTELTTKEVKRRTNGKLIRSRGVIGTDHIATESYVGKGKVTYARGWFHHRPVGRRPDHASVPLGKKWHLVVPNAVPRRRRGIQAARV